jgi:ferredoxin
VKINKILIVGAGPTSYSICRSLRGGGYKGKIILYNNSNSLMPSRIPPSFLKGSPKLRQPEFIKKNSNLYKNLNINSQDFNYISTAGLGGGINFWGASVAEFSEVALKKSDINIAEYRKNIKKVLSYMRVSGNTADGLSEYYKNFKLTPSLSPTSRVKSFFRDDNYFAIGSPRLAVDEKKCTLCGNCFDPCKTSAIWKINENDFKKLDVQIINKTIDKVKKENDKFFLLDSKNEIVGSGATLVLAANIATNFKLLCNFSKIKKATLYSTPSYSFATFSFMKVPSKLFGMGNATFIVKGNNENLSFGNLYDGQSLNIKKRNIFSQNFIVDCGLKKAAKYMIFGAGFISSENQKSKIIYKKTGLEIKSRRSDMFSRNMAIIKHNIKYKLFLFFRPIFFKFNPPGLDIHYAGGVPADLKFNPNTGSVQSVDGLYIAGGSNFKYLPPESPTLSFMVNAYGVGKSLLKDK